MQSLLTWDKEGSPFRDRQIMKEAEESMKWRGAPPNQNITV
jgi:hypothetical protein